MNITDIINKSTTTLNESKVKELSMDLKDKTMSEEEFKQKYGKTRAEVRVAMKEKPVMAEAFQNDEANLYYRYDTVDGKVKQRMVSNNDERAAFAQGFKDTPELALKAHGIIRSKFKPGKWVQNQGGKWVEVFPFGQQSVNEMDKSQTPPGRAGHVSHGTYGSRDKKDPDAGKKQYTAKGITAKQASSAALSTLNKAFQGVAEESDRQFAQRMKKKAAQPPTKGMSDAEKVDKGWRNPNIESEQIYNILALDKGNALKKPTKLKWKASSLEDIFDALAAQDWYPLEINGVEVIAGKRLKQGVAEGTNVTDYAPKSQGGTRKELLAKYHKTKDPKDAEAARKAGATQQELRGVTESKDSIQAQINECEQRANSTTSAFKRSHLLRMAQELRGQLKSND